MLTQAVSKPLPGMACLLAAFMACDVKRALRLLGRNGWDCELQRHKPSVLGSHHRHWEICCTPYLIVIPQASSTWVIALGCGCWEQSSVFRGDVMPFSRQRAASADSEAPASQTLVLSSDAYPLQLPVPSSTFKAKRSKARVLFLPPPVLCVMCP